MRGSSTFCSNIFGPTWYPLGSMLLCRLHKAKSITERGNCGLHSFHPNLNGSAHRSPAPKSFLRFRHFEAVRRRAEPSWWPLQTWSWAGQNLVLEYSTLRGRNALYRSHWGRIYYYFIHFISLWCLSLIHVCILSYVHSNLDQYICQYPFRDRAYFFKQFWILVELCPLFLF